MTCFLGCLHPSGMLLRHLLAKKTKPKKNHDVFTLCMFMFYVLYFADFAATKHISISLGLYYFARIQLALSF